jgi:DNA-directed RNA polymerase subunit RPC12/RpoP
MWIVQWTTLKKFAWIGEKKDKYIIPMIGAKTKKKTKKKFSWLQKRRSLDCSHCNFFVKNHVTVTVTVTVTVAVTVK